jgi:hypothetical protein
VNSIPSSAQRTHTIGVMAVLVAASGILAFLILRPGVTAQPNPELEAGLVLAQAQLGQARALRDRVYAGPRQEQVDVLFRCSSADTPRTRPRTYRSYSS